MTTAKAQIVFSLSREKYDALARVNWSTLKWMRRSPAHYRDRITGLEKDTPPKKVGRGTHLSCFEPERFRAECALWTGKVRRGKEWDAFKLENAGRELLTAAEYQECLDLSAAVRSSAMAAPFLSGGRSEVTVLWTHEAPAIGELPGFGLECKARLDFVANCGALVDLKTTKDASPEGFGRQVWNLRYHTQAAFYTDAYFAATGQRVPYVFVAVETARPRVVQVYTVPEIYLDLGREEYRALLQRLHDCRSESRWPSYAEQVLELSLPRWAAPLSEDEDATGLGLDFTEAATAEAS